MHPNILEDTIITVRSTFDAANTRKNNEKNKRYSMVHYNRSWKHREMKYSN